VLVACLPLGVIVAEYLIAQLVNSGLDGKLWQGAPNALGFGLHINEPIAADQFFFTELPTTWLQDRFYSPTGPSWYDAVASLIYVSHFWVIPLVAVMLWFRGRSLFRSWISCVLLLTTIGVSIYILFPMSPPWLASNMGITSVVHRISDKGFDVLHVGFIGDWLASSQGGSNPVAAMPSLHAASAVLVTLFLWQHAGWVNRVLLTAYSVLMAVTLVYAGEHYVVDVLAGWAVAIVAFSSWSLVRQVARRRSAGHR
jgi:membrane-associated phospholipid phosphatase